MSYYHKFSRSYSRPETVSGKNVQDLISTVDQVNSLTDWERSFIDSIKVGYKKYNSVTEGQHRTLQKVASRYSPENIEIRSNWVESFDDKKRETFEIMARYYKANPPYFKDLAQSALEDPKYVPSEKAYQAMCENKYAQKVLETHYSEPIYPAGTMAVARSSATAPYRIRGKTVIIIEHPEGVHSAANGAKRITVLPVGETESIETEERWIKKLPKKLR